MVKRYMILGMMLVLGFFFIGFSSQGFSEEKGLVGWWKFDEGKGKILKDHSGNGNDGEIKGPKWVKDGLRFDNKGDIVKIPASESLNITEQITILAWVKPAMSDNLYNNVIYTQNNAWFFGTLVEKARYGDKVSFNVHYGHHKAEDGGKRWNVTCQSKSCLKRDTFNHIAGTYDSETGTVKLYANGKYVVHKAGDDVPAPSPGYFQIGSRGGYYFQGIIKEVKIYNRVLSDEEIKKYYEFSERLYTGKAEGGNAETEVVICRKTETPPALDGILDDACWKKTDPITNFVEESKGTLMEVQTAVYLCYDEKNLYVGYRLDEPNMNRIKALATKRDGKVWKDDCAEFFFDTNRDKRTFVQFVVNSIGTTFDSINMAVVTDSDSSWNPDWTVETSKGDRSWHAEIAIPFKSLDISSPDGTIWGVGLGRERRAGDKPEYSCYPVKIFNQAENFGTLIFGSYLAHIKREIDSLNKELNQLSQYGKKKRISERLKREIDSIIKEVSKFSESITEKEFLIKKEWLSLQKKEVVSFKYKIDRVCLKILGDGLVVWGESPWISFSPEQKPTIESALIKLQLKAAINQYKTAVVNLTNSSDKAISVKVEITTLKEKKSKLEIPFDKIDVYQTKFITKKNSELAPDPLIKTDRFTISPYKTIQLWLTLNTFDLKPGDYTGKIKLISEDKKITEDIPLEIKLWPVILPKRPPIDYIHWDRGWPSANLEFLTKYVGDKQERYLNDQFNHYANVFIMYSVSGEISLPVCDKQGNIIKPLDFAVHDKRARRIMKKGGGKLAYRFGAVWNNKFSANLVFPAPEWKKAFTAWIEELLSRARSLGYKDEDFIFMFSDETRGKTVDYYVKFGKFFREKFPQIKVYNCNGGKTTFSDIKRLDPYVDIWDLCHSYTFRKEYSEFVKSTGKPFWVCGFFLGQPLGTGCYEKFRMQPWLVWKYQLDGFDFWAYNFWVGDPYDYSDSSSACMVYPGEDGPVTSRRWEALREGWDDYKYLYLLDKMIKEEKNQEKAKEAKMLLEEAEKEVMKNPTNYQLADYYRERIAKEIMKLKKSERRLR